MLHILWGHTLHGPILHLFFSYHPSLDPSDYSILEDNTNSNIAGQGNAVVELKPQIILLWDVIHVPTLRTPLYSIYMHTRRTGCAYDMDDNVIIFLILPPFILVVVDVNYN